MKKICFPLFMLAALAACKPQGKAADEPRVITVTIEPLRYFTEAIAGDQFTVVSMVPKGASPETYDPTPAQLIGLTRSKAYFRIGYIGFEQAWMKRLKENAPDLPFYDLSEGIDLIEGHGHPHSPAGKEKGERLVEPHIWNSTVNARIIARNISVALSQLDTLNASAYAARCDSLLQRIAQTDSLIAQKLSAPEADRAFMIYHPALSYFARDYHLRQIPIEAEGKEPSPAQLKELIDLCREEQVRVVFIQPEFDRRNALLIAQQTHTRILPINPLSYDWETEMINIAESLCK